MTKVYFASGSCLQLAPEVGHAHWEAEVTKVSSDLTYIAFPSGHATFLNTHGTQVGIKAAEIKVLSPPASIY